MGQAIAVVLERHGCLEVIASDVADAVIEEIEGLHWDLTRAALKQLTPMNTLTARVTQRLLLGWSVRRIAEDLDFSVDTVLKILKDAQDLLN